MLLPSGDCVVHRQQSLRTRCRLHHQCPPLPRPRRHLLRQSPPRPQSHIVKHLAMEIATHPNYPQNKVCQKYIHLLLFANLNNPSPGLRSHCPPPEPYNCCQTNYPTYRAQSLTPMLDSGGYYYSLNSAPMVFPNGAHCCRTELAADHLDRLLGKSRLDGLIHKHRMSDDSDS